MEEKTKLIQTARNWVRALILFAVIFALSVTITLYFKPLYYSDMERYDLAETYGVTEEEIKENYDVLISYNTLFSDEELDFPTLPMSETGRIHFEEVKEIFLTIQWIGLIGVVLLVLILIKTHRQRDYVWLKYTGWICVGLPAAVGLLMLLLWDKVFVWFHEIFFQNDYWIFDAATDPIILFLPDEFFMHCGFMIAGLILAGAVGCLIAYRRVTSFRKT